MVRSSSEYANDHIMQLLMLVPKLVYLGDTLLERFGFCIDSQRDFLFVPFPSEIAYRVAEAMQRSEWNDKNNLSNKVPFEFIVPGSKERTAR